MSAARHAYGLPGGALAEESSRGPSGALPLLLLVVGLAAATIWFVALPAFDKPPAERSCEVVFLESGAPQCLEKPAFGSPAAPKTSKQATPAKR